MKICILVLVATIFVVSAGVVYGNKLHIDMKMEFSSDKHDADVESTDNVGDVSDSPESWGLDTIFFEQESCDSCTEIEEETVVPDQ